MRNVRSAAFLLACGVVTSCTFDSAYRDTPAPPVCTVGQTRCYADAQQAGRGEASSPSAHTPETCKAPLTWVAAIQACASCIPGGTQCVGQDVQTCNAAGMKWTTTQTCDTSTGHACRNGECEELCDEAAAQLSNVGCEYWGADLDNADVSPSENAAAQQYAIVVSNVQPDVPAHVIVEQDDSLPGRRCTRSQWLPRRSSPRRTSTSSTWVHAKWTVRPTGRSTPGPERL